MHDFWLNRILWTIETLFAIWQYIEGIVMRSKNLINAKTEFDDYMKYIARKYQ